MLDKTRCIGSVKRDKKGQECKKRKRRKRKRRNGKEKERRGERRKRRGSEKRREMNAEKNTAGRKDRDKTGPSLSQMTISRLEHGGDYRMEENKVEYTE